MQEKSDLQGKSLANGDYTQWASFKCQFKGENILIEELQSLLFVVISIQDGGKIILDWSNIILPPKCQSKDNWLSIYFVSLN